jgi:hypothetical protein
MKNFQKFDTIQDELNYLKDSGEEVSCEKVLKAHAVTADEVIEIEGRALSKSVADVEKLIGKYGYEFYTTFDIDRQTNDILDLVLISKFVLDPPCYSTKLLRCVIKANHLNSDDNFVFFNAAIGGEKKIVIKVEDASGASLYDISQSPY